MSRRTVRLDADDDAALAALAARLGLSPSAVLRAGLHTLVGEVDGRRTPPPGPPSAAELAATRAAMELRRIGINVNQVVRHINSARFGDADDAELLLELVEELTAAVEAVTS